MRRRTLLMVLVASACLGGCGFVYDQKIDEAYRLVAVDVLEQAMVCRSLTGGNCSGDGLPGPTVFAAGADDRYLVMARHPAGYPAGYGGIDRSVTEYFYVTRHRGDPPVGVGDVVGPLTRSEFEAEAQRLRLPPFSRRISRVE
ncbi:hypothetical protein [Phenylobacterium sp.]|uniref:hypothetical protein n=1 Tax=Phenylobacterium sp. TaxID=1871053 RepID=UPI00301CD082